MADLEIRVALLERRVGFLQVTGGLTAGACLWLAYGLWLALAGLPDRHCKAGNVDRDADPPPPVVTEVVADGSQSASRQRWREPVPIEGGVFNGLLYRLPAPPMRNAMPDPHADDGSAQLGIFGPAPQPEAAGEGVADAA